MLRTKPAKPAKPARCRHCKERTDEPVSRHPVGYLHSSCVMGWAAADRAKRAAAVAKADRAKLVKFRKDNLSIPKMLRLAREEFNTCIRLRDRELPCISCGAPPPDPLKFHGGRDAGHYRSVGAAGHLRFHEDNVHAQCVHCNRDLAGNVVMYRKGLLARIGLERVEALEDSNEVNKWTREVVQNVIDTYRAKRRELEKEIANA